MVEKEFKDSDGDTIGDFAGVKSELDCFVKTVVGTVYISSFFASPKASGLMLLIIDKKTQHLNLWRIGWLW